MGSTRCREHAEHNERLCYHLLAHDDWYDWVITTAFYSCIHFIDDALFPLDIDGEFFQDFEEFAVSSSARDLGRNPHQIRAGLVHKYLHKSYQAYKWLSDKCHTGRYIDYRTTKPFAEQAKIKLEVVKQACDSRIAKATKKTK